MIWRWFWREWRSPALLIVWLSLALAVACVLALGRIGDRIDKSIYAQSRDLIAGDLVLRASYPVDENWLAEAKRMGLTLSRQMQFTTMSYAPEGDTPQLALVKAADNLYPLYGQLETQPVGLKAEKGTALVDARLLALLGIKVGDNIDVGDATFTISGVLVQEPDSGFNPFQIAPRILINLADVEATGAVQPGSRLTYRYMFAGNEALVDEYQQRFDPLLKPDQRWNSLKQDNGALSQSMERAKNFLLLSALLTLLLAISAVAVSMTHYCRSRHTLIAVLKTLGADNHALRKWIIGQWGVIIVAAIVVGSLVGWGFELVLLQILAPVLPKSLPDASLMPWLWSVGSLLLIALLTGLRPYHQLMSTQPSRVLRSGTTAPSWPLRYYLPIVALIVIGALTLFAGTGVLLWSILLGVVVIAFLLGVIGWLGLWLLKQFKFKQLSARLAVTRLLRQPFQTMTQLAAFSLSFMLLTLLVLLQGDLLEKWQQQLPEDSPNYFLINMSKAQVQPINTLLATYHVAPTDAYPVVLARLTAINDHNAKVWADARDAGNNTVRRELNLTWHSELPKDNVIVEGTWPPVGNGVSIDQGVAQKLEIKLGDELTFVGDTREFKSIVTSIRHVDWENMRPNFFFIFAEEGLNNQPEKWMSSFYYNGDGSLITALNRQFPTVSVLDTGALIQQVQQILQQVSRALEIMVGLVMLCGALLLVAQIQVGMTQRRIELVVYRTLGASKSLLRRTLWAEFALLGLMAGLAAAIGAEVALGLLQKSVFNFPWQPQWMMWIVVPALAAVLLSLCGSILGVRLLQDKGQYRRIQGE
ncbi:TPA: ABC transporter permease [Proteus mirabilis]|nr:ABC transporter permease [Proteus mirabilis]